MLDAILLYALVTGPLQTGCLEVVHELLLRGARVSAKGRKGQTALDCARKRSEISALLGAAASGGKRPLPPLPPPAAPTEPSPARVSPAALASGSLPASTQALLNSYNVTAPPPLHLLPDPKTSKAVPEGTVARGGGGHKAGATQQLLTTSASSASSSSAHPSGSSSAAVGAPSSVNGSRLGPAPSSLSALLQTLQNYNMPAALAQHTGGGGGLALPPSDASASTQLPPLTPLALARINASGPSAPQLLAQLQDALSNAMKTHGLDSALGTGELTVGGQCSLQPGRIFGQLRCLQPTDAGGSSGEGSSSKAAAVEDKLLYMYCSNNCGFQFHASCWKVGMAEAWLPIRYLDELCCMLVYRQ